MASFWIGFIMGLIGAINPIEDWGLELTSYNDVMYSAQAYAEVGGEVYYGNFIPISTEALGDVMLECDGVF